MPYLISFGVDQTKMVLFPAIWYLCGGCGQSNFIITSMADQSNANCQLRRKPPGCLNLKDRELKTATCTFSHLTSPWHLLFSGKQGKTQVCFKKTSTAVRWRRYESCPRCWHLASQKNPWFWAVGVWERTSWLRVYCLSFLWNFDEHICYHLLYLFWSFLTIFHWSITFLLFWKVTILGCQLQNTHIEWKRWYIGNRTKLQITRQQDKFKRIFYHEFMCQTLA